MHETQLICAVFILLLWTPVLITVIFRSYTTPEIEKLINRWDGWENLRKFDEIKPPWLNSINVKVRSMSKSQLKTSGFYQMRRPQLIAWQLASTASYMIFIVAFINKSMSTELWNFFFITVQVKILLGFYINF